MIYEVIFEVLYEVIHEVIYEGIHEGIHETIYEVIYVVIYEVIHEMIYEVIYEMIYEVLWSDLWSDLRSDFLNCLPERKWESCGHALAAASTFCAQSSKTSQIHVSKKISKKNVRCRTWNSRQFCVYRNIPMLYHGSFDRT